jgi:predicted CXXCH cytochrome family protein
MKAKPMLNLRFNRMPSARPSLWLGAMLALLLAHSACGIESVISSKHNLSVSGPGDIKAATETEICVFCHTPHRGTGETPLWNHALSGATYTPYASSTIKAAIGQPTGASKLCLSCHDGTVALGLVNSRSGPIEMQNGATTMPAGPSNLGKDLSGHHPVSFTYDAALATQDGQLKDPSLLKEKVRLDHNQQMQCTACHDPHNNQFGKFLVQDNYASALCVNCHSPEGWSGSVHRTSSKTWSGAGINPWPHSTNTTVAANACENCHAPHAAGTKPRLLNFVNEEMNCYSCHSGKVAALDLQNEFNKISVHPITATAGVHDPVEDPVNPPRHVECADCHNPHAANSAPADPPNVSGALASVVGITAAGTVIHPLTKEYELCFRCHGDSLARGPAYVMRQFVETNLRQAFWVNNSSFHPVVGSGRNPNVPSLISPYTSGSVISCTDCHNNNQGPGAGGTGPRGPHGSIYTPLLERRLETTDGTSESVNAYALCYKCHSQTSILNDDSFKGHFRHVVTDKIACTSCHDSHGVAGQANLINFNTTYASPSSNGRMEFVKTGTFRGNCSVTCHGTDHAAQTYSPEQPLNLLRRGLPGRNAKPR